MALSVLVISGSAALYAFSMRRASQDAGKAQVMAQAQAVLEDISRTVRQSIGCDSMTLSASGTFAGAKVLRCAMPRTIVDTDGKAGPDSYLADTVNEGGAEVYLPGSYIFYIWLAEGWEGDPEKRMVRITQNSPDPASLTENLETWDPIFTFSAANDEKFRFNRLTSLEFRVDSQNRSVLVTIQGAALGFQSSVNSSAGEQNNIKSLALSRRVGWMNDIDPREQGRGPNLLVNGDFGLKTMTGWTTSGSAWGLGNTLSYSDSSFNLLQMNWSNAVGDLVLKQSVATTPGEEHLLSFSYGWMTGSPMEDRFGQLRVTVTDTASGAILLQRVVADRSGTSSYTTLWTDYSFGFEPTSGLTEIKFEDVTDSPSTIAADALLAKVAVRRLN